MKAKTLLLTALVSAATVVAASAQVYSVNVVGYVTKTVPASGFALLANPLQLEDASLANVLPDVPANTKVYEFNPATGQFLIYTLRQIGPNLMWTGTGADTAQLEPGEGFFLLNPTAEELSVTFVGEVMEGTLEVTIHPGFTLVSSKAPTPGMVQTDLGMPAVAGDKVYKFNPGTQQYLISTLREIPPGSGNLQWTGGAGGEPEAEVGEGWFVESTSAEPVTWTRDFEVE